MTAPSDLVLRFLRSIGRPAEAELYLELFRAEAAERFALIEVDPALQGLAHEALAVDLHFLAELGLTPVLALASREQAVAMREGLAPAVRAVIVPPEDAAVVARAGGVALVEIPAPTADRDFLAELATALVTRKVVLLGPRPGLGPDAGQDVSLIDITTELDDLLPVLPGDEADVLRRVARLIDAVPHSLSVAVTSPLALLLELFTVRGAGTLIRRGARVKRYERIEDLDRARLAELIESAFGRPLTNGFLERKLARVYVADEYRGAAILIEAEPASYLSKFAVDTRARGEGIGRDLWRAIERDYAAFFWRSRPSNPITPWYQQQCSGMARIPGWYVFWRGLPDDAIGAAIQHARNAAPDFGD